MTLPRILTAVCGAPPDCIEAEHGNYLRWFSAAVGDQATLIPWEIQAHGPQPALNEFAGILITGSSASLTQPKPWMENAVEMIREASERKIPVLGICFGHQLIGCAFGAPTTQAPEGGEHESCEISLNSEGLKDPIFRALPKSFSVHLTHYDEVDPPAILFSHGLRVLASSTRCGVMAMAAGESIRSVQYHPEFSTAIMQSYIEEESRQRGLHAEGPATMAKDCRLSSQIFDNWINHWILERSQ